MILNKEIQRFKDWKIDSSDKVVSISSVIKETPCFNCYQDTSGFSSGRFNADTGTIEFKRGQICPVCKGSGRLSINKNISPICKIKNNLSEKVRNELGINTETSILVFVKFIDMENIKVNSKLEIYIDEKRFELVGFYKDNEAKNFRLELKGDQI